MRASSGLLPSRLPPFYSSSYWAYYSSSESWVIFTRHFELTTGSAPFVNGGMGVLSVFMIAGLLFQGTEMVGIAAGEAEDPDRNIPGERSAPSFGVSSSSYRRDRRHRLSCPTPIRRSSTLTATSPFLPLPLFSSVRASLRPPLL